MPRKRKGNLCIKKNVKRKKAIKKSLQQQCISLKVSLPIPKINLVTATKAKDINHLYNLLNNSNLISSTWSLSKEERGSVLFCHKLKCDTSQLTSAVIMTVVIQNNFKWSLTCMAHLIDKSCLALVGQSELLQTPKEVADVLTMLDNYSICIGNNDERFIDLMEKRKGVIKNQSGIYIYLSIYLFLL